MNIESLIGVVILTILICAGTMIGYHRAMVSDWWRKPRDDQSELCFRSDLSFYGLMGIALGWMGITAYNLIVEWLFL